MKCKRCKQQVEKGIICPKCGAIIIGYDLNDRRKNKRKTIKQKDIIDDNRVNS